MNKQEIEKYLEEHEKFEMPDFQEQFSLTYAEVDKIFGELQKKCAIKFCGGFSYETVRESESGKHPKAVFIPKNEQEAFFIKALWECVKNRVAGTSFVQHRLSCSYLKAAHAIEWMEENDFISPYPERTVRMGVEEYNE